MTNPKLYTYYERANILYNLAYGCPPPRPFTVDSNVQDCRANMEISANFYLSDHDIDQTVPEFLANFNKLYPLQTPSFVPDNWLQGEEPKQSPAEDNTPVRSTDMSNMYDYTPKSWDWSDGGYVGEVTRDENGLRCNVQDDDTSTLSYQQELNKMSDTTNFQLPSFSLFDADYKPPVDGDTFLKMAKTGAPIKFVPVGTIATGFSYWTNDKKCIRSPKRPTETPNIRIDDKGKTDTVKHYWVMPVYDCASSTVKLLEITQLGVRQAITAINDGPDYDLSSMQQAIKISAVGSGLDTKYTVLVVPFKEAELKELLAALPGNDIITRGAAAVIADMNSDTPTPAAPATATPIVTKAAAADMM